MQKNKKIMSLILVFLLFVSIIPVPAFGTPAPFVVNYTATEGGALNASILQGNDMVYIVNCASGTNKIYLYYPSSNGGGSAISNLGSSYLIADASLIPGFNGEKYSNGWYEIDLSNFSGGNFNIGDFQVDYNLLDPSCDYYKISILSLTMTPLYYIIVQVGDVLPDIDKTQLESIINEASEYALDTNTDYYHVNDRYNGKINNKLGFWNNMKAELGKAEETFNSNEVSQGVIDKSVVDLQNAIDNMIPTVNINATELYEEINTAPRRPTGGSGTNPEKWFTSSSWQEYNTEKASAQALLDSLYDDEGKPTPKNQSSDTAVLAEIESKVSNLKSVRESMDPLLGNDDTEDVKIKYDALRNFLRVYSVEKINKTLYTDDSYVNYLSAYTSVKSYLDKTPSPSGEAGKKQYDELKSLYLDFWRGIHGLKDKKDNITVTVKVVDTLGVRLGSSLNKSSGVHSIVLSGNQKTLDTAIDSLNDEVLSSYNDIYKNSNYLYVTSINGILSTGGLSGSGRSIAPLKFRSPEVKGSSLPPNYYQVQLHDGDIITLAFLDQPTVPGSAGVGHDAIPEDQIHEYYRQSSLLFDGRVTDGTIEVLEGEELSLSAIYAMPHISTYSEGRTYPLSGATLFVSAPAEDIDNITPAGTDTGIVSDDDGSMVYGFYEPGYYALSIHALGKNELNKKAVPGVTIGDTIYVNVVQATPEQLEKTRQDFKDKLQALHDIYPETFFTANDWKDINELFNTGMTDLTSASDIKTMKSRYDIAHDGISEIHKRVTDENTALLSGFRSILSRLPDDVSLLGKSGEFLAEELVNRYVSMTEYQKNLLTGIETNKYIAIKAAYEKGLPELEPHELKLKLEADSPEAQAALEQMIAYIRENGREADTLYKFGVTVRNIEGKTAGRMSVMSVATSPSAIEGVYCDVSTGAAMRAFAVANDAFYTSSAYPDSYVLFVPTIDRFVYNITGNISGNSWIIIDDDESVDNTLVKGRTILITGIPYEIKGIEVSGLDSLNYVDYKAGTQVFPNAQNNFIMPYGDVEVVVNWGPVDENADPETDPVLAVAKANAVAGVRNTFSQYKSNEYTEEGWNQLIAARDTGISEINAAKTEIAVEEAKNRAIAAMAAVEKKKFEGTTPLGKVVGTVDLYAENTTFSGGEWTGTFIRKEGYEFGEDDTMMTVILRALKDAGFSWNGGGTDDYEIMYLASIHKDGKSLGEFSGDPGSGWMATLNDFFVNESLQAFTYKNGKLEDGDEIKLLYTQNLGVDLNGTWGNSDTSLSDLKLSTGKLYPSFNSGTYNYTLMIPSATGRVKVTPTASNKNYLVKTFLNDKVTTNKEGASYYKRTRYIPVKSGDYINIGVGEYAWPSMNNQETEARNYTGTWYRLDIISVDKGADRVISLINALPSSGRIDLRHEDEIKSIRSIYDALTSSEKDKVTNISKLEDAEKRIVFLKEIEAVKDLLKKIPAASKVTLKDKDAVMAADAAYKKLTDEQKLYITVGDVKNYNDAIDRLTELGAFNSGNAPSKIVGSDAIPLIEGETIDVKAETKVVNKEATSRVTDKQVKEALEEAAKTEDISSITIKAETREEITKSTVVVPKSSVSDISGARLDLKVETPMGTISLPEKALTEIARQAQGSTVEIIIENIAAEKLTHEQKTSAEGSTVYEISIMSDGKKISSFGGQKITISLPYTLKPGEKAENVTVWYMNDKGELEKISCTYNEKTGLVTFTTDHLSYYVVGYENKISFVDVTEDDWFYEYVMYAVQKGLFSGTEENTFSPNMAMTRSMLVTVLYRMDGSPAVTAANTFTDVGAGQWYTDAVIWANASGIVTGYGEGKFGTNDPITREQMAAILYRYAQAKGYDVTKTDELTAFTDASSVSTWAEPAVKWAVSQELMTGTSSTTLSPTGTATRAQVAAILQRYIENVK